MKVKSNKAICSRSKEKANSRKAASLVAKVKRLLAIDAFGDEFTVADLLDDASIDEVTHQLGGAEVVVGGQLGLLLLTLKLVEPSHLGPHVVLPV